MSFWAIFCPFTSPNNLENKDPEKIKKAYGDVIILNFCNKSMITMMYAYSDMECDRQLFAILGHFLIFYTTIDPKNQNLEKM